MLDLLGKVGNQLEAVDNLASSSRTTLNSNGQNTAKAASQILLRGSVRRVFFQARVRDPRHMLVILEPLGQRQGISSVALATQTQRLQAENQLLGSEGVQCRAQVPQNLDTHADSEGDRTEGLPELQSVVALGGLDELWEAGGVLAPVKLTAVDDHAADGGAVTTDPLGCALDDDVRTVVNGTGEVAAGTEGVVNLRSHRTVSHDLVWLQPIRERTYHEGNTLVMCHLRDGLKIGHIIAGVTNSLNIHSLGAIINSSCDILGLVAIDKLSSYTQAREEHLKLVICATVQVASRNDVIASMGQRRDSHELSGLAGRGSDSSNTTLEGGNTLLENVDGGVHNAAVNVAEFLEAEEPRAVGGVIEGIGGCCVDGDCARVGGRVRLMAGGTNVNHTLITRE